MQDRLSFYRFSASLVLMLTLGCSEDTLKEIAPRIAVSVCETPVVQVDGKVLGGVDDCEVAFGVSDISAREIKEIVVSNPSSVELIIDSVQLTEDTDPAFRVDLSPESIGPGLSAVVQLSFRPNFETEIGGKLEIYSNAKNLGQGDAVIIDLTGTGVTMGCHVSVGAGRL